MLPFSGLCNDNVSVVIKQIKGYRKIAKERNEIESRWLLTLELGEKDFITHLAPKRNASLSDVMHAST